MERYKRIMDGIAKVIFVITGALICAMVLIITWQVFSRFVMNKTPRWSEEFTLVLMLFTGFLGASLAYRERMHIGIKVFLMMMKPLTRNRVYFFIDTLIGLFSIFMITWGAGFSWMMRNQTLPATKIKVGISYLPIPLTGLLLLLFVIEKIGTDLAERKTGATDDPLNLPPSEV